MDELLDLIHDDNSARVITSNYFKGGVGKTKLLTIFAYLLNKKNIRTLFIDTDLQATLTKDLEKTFEIPSARFNFYEAIQKGNLKQAIVNLTPNLDLISGSFEMMKLPKYTRSFSFEKETTLLKNLIEPFKQDYDFIFIDTIPTPSVYTNNSIVASDYVIIPIQAEEESYNNVENYISYLIDLQEQFNPALDIIGIVPYLMDSQSTTNRFYLDKLYSDFKEEDFIFKNYIKRSNRIGTWARNGITENKSYDKKILTMYNTILEETMQRILELENEKRGV